MSFPKPPQRVMSRQDKTILLMAAISENNPAKISVIKALDWDADNIYPISAFDATGTHLLRPVRRGFLGSKLNDYINKQRIDSLKDLINIVMPMRRPVRGPARTGREGKARNSDRSLIWRKVDYNFSSSNIGTRQILRRLLLGHKLTMAGTELEIAKQGIIKELSVWNRASGQRLCDIIMPLKHNVWHDFLVTL